MTSSPTLVWLRYDLRLADNPALAAASAAAGPIAALYIHETDTGLRPIGAAARWWLHQSLVDLAPRLARLGIPLLVRRGDSAKVLDAVLAETGARAVHWNRRYAPAERAVDEAIKTDLSSRGFTATSHPGNVLAEPWTVETGQGKPYSVFTPFWKSLRDRPIARPLPAPAARGPALPSAPPVDDDYVAPRWSEKLASHWQVGEAAAARRLVQFLDTAVARYPEQRDRPGVDATSRLSPYLRFGEVSPRQVWHAARTRAEMVPDQAGAIEKFLSELAWRDFSYHQLFFREDIAQVPMQPRYAGMAWRDDPVGLAAWQRGQTGIPIVDAGMREMWETGVMHNRVRMLVASLLSKNMLVDWRLGEAWFWDCLVDADIANNPASWQWVAGSGLDAAPYFRIFNPVTQGERFDPDGAYVRRWVPELAKLPDAAIHEPAEAAPDLLRAAGVMLGKTYPHPIVDLKATRQRALDAQAALA